MKKILVTGAAGFIGFHLSKHLLEDGDNNVIGLDNLNDYYDVNLKNARISMLREYGRFRFVKMDLAEKEEIEKLFKKEEFEIVVNLAAQAGVRYSLTNPYVYINSNLYGFINILEHCKNTNVKHLVFASSSSVYGANILMPFSVHHNVDHPVSLYGATKKANELIAHAYADLYGLPCTGLRFFTVYGPWGRPDMALFLFTEAILKNKPIEIFNYGKMKRDFTYIDDIIEGIIRVMDKIPESNPKWNREKADPGSSYAPYKIYNIGNNNPVELMEFINLIEKYLGRVAKKNFLPMQKGDVMATYADIDDLISAIEFKPKTKIEKGIKNFVEWYCTFYKVRL
jgi:UDP-glucuronate 4-epimerase